MQKIYVIQFNDGSFANGHYWTSAKNVTQAKVYPTLARARQAMSYHKSIYERYGAKIVAYQVNYGDPEVVE